MLIFGICVLILLALFSSGCFEDDNEKEKDTDGDGIPDDEDDYPENENLTANLEVTKSKIFDDPVQGSDKKYWEVFIEFQNNKNYPIDTIHIYVTFSFSSGSPATIHKPDWSGNVLQPGERAISSAGVFDSRTVDSYNIVIKANKGGENWTKPNVEIVSDSLISDDTVKVEMKNNGTENITVETWIAYFDVDGEFLDTYEGTFSTQLAPGETGTKKVESYRGPVSTYDVYLKFV